MTLRHFGGKGQERLETVDVGTATTVRCDGGWQPWTAWLLLLWWG